MKLGVQIINGREKAGSLDLAALQQIVLFPPIFDESLLQKMSAQVHGRSLTLLSKQTLTNFQTIVWCIDWLTSSSCPSLLIF